MHPCSEILDRLAALAAGAPLPPEAEAHLAACAACRAEAGTLQGLDAGALGEAKVLAASARVDREALRARIAPASSRRWVWAAAAGLLLAAGVWALRPPGAVPEAAPFPPPEAGAPDRLGPGGWADLPDGSRLELAEGARGAWREGSGLALAEGACWIATGALPLELAEGVRLSPGTEAELRIPPPSRAALLLQDACAAGEGAVLSVVSGVAEVRGVALAAGQRILLDGGEPEPLSDAERDRIDAWRCGRLLARTSPSGVPSASAGPGAKLLVADPGEPRILVAEFRTSGAHLLLRSGDGEVALGNLAVWKDGTWHRLVARASRSGAEVFLDGRRVLKAPAGGVGGARAFGLEVLGGSLEVRSLASGRDAR